MFYIKNNGKKRVFQTTAGYLRIDTNETVEIFSKPIADELANYKAIDVSEAESAPVEIPGLLNTEIDYSLYGIQELRNIASHLGIKNTFTMKKSELIKAII